MHRYGGFFDRFLGIFSNKLHVLILFHNVFVGKTSFCDFYVVLHRLLSAVLN